jgi:hypothetical protein
VPKDYNLPPGGQPFSTGAKRIEVFSPRGQFGRMERTIMEILDSRSLSSLGELNEVLIPEEISKASRAKLSYYVRKLESEGFVEFVLTSRNKDLLLND